MYWDCDGDRFRETRRNSRSFPLSRMIETRILFVRNEKRLAPVCRSRSSWSTPARPTAPWTCAALAYFSPSWRKKERKRPCGVVRFFRKRAREHAQKVRLLGEENAKRVGKKRLQTHLANPPATPTPHHPARSRDATSTRAATTRRECASCRSASQPTTGAVENSNVWGGV